MATNSLFQGYWTIKINHMDNKKLHFKTVGEDLTGENGYATGRRNWEGEIPLEYVNNNGIKLEKEFYYDVYIEEVKRNLKNMRNFYPYRMHFLEKLNEEEVKKYGFEG